MWWLAQSLLIYKQGFKPSYYGADLEFAGSKFWESKKDHIRQLKNQVNKCTKGTKSISEYLRTTELKTEEFAELGKPMDMEDITDNVLAGYPNITNQRSMPSTEERRRYPLLNTMNVFWTQKPWYSVRNQLLSWMFILQRMFQTHDLVIRHNKHNRDLTIITTGKATIRSLTTASHSHI